MNLLLGQILGALRSIGPIPVMMVFAPFPASCNSISAKPGRRSTGSAPLTAAS